MRSTIQGEVYRQIIDKVILQAQTDFEEGGYTQETLQELKLVSDNDWQSASTQNQPWPAASGILSFHMSGQHWT
jgi:hypothetical protein